MEVNHLLIYLLAIIALFMQVKDYKDYRSFKRKKFSDGLMFFFIGLYSLIYFLINFGVVPLMILISSLVIGEFFFFYIGLAAIQRREFNFLWGAHAKGEGIKWIGLFWIIVSIVWMFLRFII